MNNFHEEISTQIRKLRGQVESFVSEKISPTLEKATTRLKATVDTTSRLDALIALLVAKGTITEEELKASEKARANTPSQTVQDTPEPVQPPAQNQV
jgi:polyhydroxyalkanoate synthesis regulator phasin